MNNGDVPSFFVCLPEGRCPGQNLGGHPFEDLRSFTSLAQDICSLACADEWIEMLGGTSWMNIYFTYLYVVGGLEHFLFSPIVLHGCYCWLVVWNMNFIFPYIGNNNPN